MTRVISHRHFWLLLLGVAAINSVLMYAPEAFHFAALITWSGLAIWSAIQLRRAYKPSGEVIMHGFLIGVALSMVSVKPSEYLLLSGFGSFDNVERSLLRSSDSEGEAVCWGSHGAVSCD